ncbi:hypothetical protein [Caballeronia sp. LjRoot31]|uniref:hypothetical protein n=1 Tax=Caballeronia sp. LjRoot31 TaxID=3342324 RepID=UPI003ECC2444
MESNVLPSRSRHQVREENVSGLGTATHTAHAGEPSSRGFFFAKMELAAAHEATFCSFRDFEISTAWNLLYQESTFESPEDSMNKTIKHTPAAFLRHVGTNGAVFLGVMLIAAVVDTVRQWLLSCGMDPATGYVFSLAEWLLMVCDLVVFGILVARGANHVLFESRKSAGPRGEA